MKLYIRSQDRMRLIPNPNLYVVESESREVTYIGDTMVGHIGEYKTKERALEVLDEIQDILNPKIMLINNSKESFDNFLESGGIIVQPSNTKTDFQQLDTCVYQMPQE